MANDSGYSDKWEIVADLSSGGQATTYRVKSTLDESIGGVLKQLRNNKSPQARRRMFREVANLRIVADAGGHVPRVQDDNVAQFENTSAKLYFVMEYVEGPTLDTYIKEHGRLNLDVAVGVVLDVCALYRLGMTKMFCTEI